MTSWTVKEETRKTWRQRRQTNLKDRNEIGRRRQISIRKYKKERNIVLCA